MSSIASPKSHEAHHCRATSIANSGVFRTRDGEMKSAARVLERSRRAPRGDHNEIAKRGQPTYLDKASAITGDRCKDWRAGQVREWLWLLLRFAVTSDPRDQSAALALAEEIDALGLEWRPSGPTFFRRTTREVCDAISALDDPKRTAVLNRHIARIDNPALRRAFRAVVNREEHPSSLKRKRRDLWTAVGASAVSELSHSFSFASRKPKSPKKAAGRG